MSVEQRLDDLYALRDDTRDALLVKGVDASNHGFAQFPADIRSIVQGGGDEQYDFANAILLNFDIPSGDTTWHEFDTLDYSTPKDYFCVVLTVSPYAYASPSIYAGYQNTWTSQYSRIISDITSGSTALRNINMGVLHTIANPPLGKPSVKCTRDEALRISVVLIPIVDSGGV